MSNEQYALSIDLEFESRYPYQCNACQRSFVVMSRRIHESGTARCPDCSSDDVVRRRLSRRERITRFLMMYEAA